MSKVKDYIKGRLNSLDTQAGKAGADKESIKIRRSEVVNMAAHFGVKLKG